MEEKSKEILQAKKKLAMIIAGIITFLIFCGWIVYFLHSIRNISPDSKGGLGSFIGDIQDNAGKSFSEIQNVTGELNQKIKLVGDYYSSVKSGQATTTETNNQ